MRKPYVNKTFGKIQNFLDELKAHPEKRYEIYNSIKETITKEEIEKHELKEVIDKIVTELKDFSYDDITKYIA
jgi:23S rRNA maturation-related 3'-5' exoribonuclease YhaM